MIENENLNVKGLVANDNKETAIKLVKLEGKNIKKTPIYIYVKLFNSK